MSGQSGAIEIDIDPDEAFVLVEILADDLIQSEVSPLQLFDTQLKELGVMGLYATIETKFILQILFKAHLEPPFVTG